MKFPTSGLYAITQPENKSADTVITEVSAALRGGAAVIQYRDKAAQDTAYLAEKLLATCHQCHVPLIINDDIELAVQIGADGLHLGQDDGTIDQARARLGNRAIIGISCYDSLERAVAAEHQGANYVAFGRFFPSSSKPLAAPAHMKTLQEAKQTLHIPVVAIGGILPENGAQLLSAGADLLAVIGGIFEQDPEQSARHYQALFDSRC